MSDSQITTSDDLAQAALRQANASSGVPVGGSADETAEALTGLQNIIERNANELDRIKEQLKIERNSLKNVFENDTELAQVEEQATQVVQQVKERKSKLQTSPQVTQLKSKIGELNDQKKEIEEALNNHLLNLYHITGTNTFDTSDGAQREFRVRASLMGSKKPEEVGVVGE